MGASIISKLREMREWKRRNPAVPATSPSFNGAALRQAINKDQALSSTQKTELHGWLEDPETVKSLQSGGVGAALSYMVSKYLKLKPQTQLLLSIAGFGVGKIIYDYKTNPKKFSTYNEQLRMYEIHD